FRFRLFQHDIGDVAVAQQTEHESSHELPKKGRCHKSSSPLRNSTILTQSTQSNVRVTAFFQRRYCSSRDCGSACGCHVRAALQFSTSSAVSLKNPVARPAA